MRWLERDSAGACDAALGGGVLIPEAPCTVACLYIPDFLVALARREHPELKGRPVVIGGSP
ncbi:MAG TPA: hypothetical protein QGF35_05280, partial [Dehalococcoidia bacterium]|nr:hypothetical protein [Dehalococcoidia bacterium]